MHAQRERVPLTFVARRQRRSSGASSTAHATPAPAPSATTHAPAWPALGGLQHGRSRAHNDDAPGWHLSEGEWRRFRTKPPTPHPPHHPPCFSRPTISGSLDSEAADDAAPAPAGASVGGSDPGHTAASGPLLETISAPVGAAAPTCSRRQGRTCARSSICCTSGTATCTAGRRLGDNGSRRSSSRELDGRGINRCDLAPLRPCETAATRHADTPTRIPATHTVNTVIHA